MRFKKVIAGFLAAGMIVTCSDYSDHNTLIDFFAIHANAESYQNDNYKYEVWYDNNRSKIAYITGYLGSGSEVVIPEEIDGCKVVKISLGAFKDRKDITNVVIPSSVKEISNVAFENCGLTSVVIPDTVTVIGARAFSGCTELENISISASVNEISSYVFENCTKLDNVILPDSVDKIGHGAFTNCKSLQSIIIPDSVSTLSRETFMGCSNLSTVVLPNNLKEISYSAFRGCSSLNSIDIPPSVNTVKPYAFADTGLKSVNITNDNITIFPCAFAWKIEEKESAHSFVICGNKGSGAERVARQTGLIFKSLDDNTVTDYYSLPGCEEATVANYNATVDFLNEFYIKKYPEAALDILHGTKEDRELFTVLAQKIISENPNISAPEALYNWMNENITGGDSGYAFGYASDTYNYKTAHCLGNANLLCELMRSAGIPAVIAYGYVGDMRDILNEGILADKKINGESLDAGHAWVMYYYNDQWMTADSSMNYFFKNKEDICRWYMTTAIEEPQLSIYNSESNFATSLTNTLLYYKDGQLIPSVVISGEAEKWGAMGNINLREKMYSTWEDTAAKGYNYLDDDSPTKNSPNKDGWIYHPETSRVFYKKSNGFIATAAVKEKDGRLIYLSAQEGYPIDITDFENRYFMWFEMPVLKSGQTFDLDVFVTEPEKYDVVWTSDNENYVTVNSDGTITTKNDNGVARLSYTVYEKGTTKVSSDGYFDVHVEDFALSQVTSIEAIPDDSSVKISWKAPESADSYVVKQLVDNVWLDVAITTSTSATIDGLTNSETYVFAVDSIESEVSHGGCYISMRFPSDATVTVTPSEDYECDHVSSDWITDKQATPIEKGSKHKECTKCGEVLETAEIEKTQEEKLFDDENEKAPESVDVDPTAKPDDCVTSIIINPAFNMKHKDGESDVELDLTNIKVKAKEIYDNEEKIAKAEEALGIDVNPNKHYNLLDLTLWEGNKEISNSYEGLVKVIIPIPAGHVDKNFSCYRLTESGGKMIKEEIPSIRENGNVIIYLEHFSTYALVEVAGNIISGNISSRSAGGETSLALINRDGVEVYSATGTDSYSFGDVANGTYTLRVSKSKYCTREYTITVNGKSIEKDVELQLYGDIDNNGIVTLDDVIDVINYFNKKKSVISSADKDLQEYLCKVSDVDGDGVVKLDDAIEMINYFNKKASAFDKIA